jgi:hypothetical protein
MFKKKITVNMLEMVGCILYFIAWSRKFKIDVNRFVHIGPENDEYRLNRFY